MNIAIETSAVVSGTNLLVSLFKLAWPTAPSWALVVASLLIGIAAAVVISISLGGVPTAQSLATNVIQGVGAAAAAAGIDRASQIADAKRSAARMAHVRSGEG